MGDSIEKEWQNVGQLVSLSLTAKFVVIDCNRI